MLSNWVIGRAGCRKKKVGAPTDWIYLPKAAVNRQHCNALSIKLANMNRLECERERDMKRRDEQSGECFGCDQCANCGRERLRLGHFGRTTATNAGTLSTVVNFFSLLSKCRRGYASRQCELQGEKAQVVQEKQPRVHMGIVWCEWRWLVPPYDVAFIQHIQTELRSLPASIIRADLAHSLGRCCCWCFIYWQLFHSHAFFNNTVHAGKGW